MYLTVYLCRKHDNVSICLESEDGGGTRFYGYKCCLKQYEHNIAKFDLHKNAEITKQFICSLEDSLD